jgi:hypothetical protein
MSGWQRIGVVLSVLWTLAVPTLFMVDQNLKVDRRYDECLDRAYSGPRDELSDQFIKNCERITNDFITPSYFVTGHDAWALWIFFIALPLALFWILGGATFTMSEAGSALFT